MRAGGPGQPSSPPRAALEPMNPDPRSSPVRVAVILARMIANGDPTARAQAQHALAQHLSWQPRPVLIEIVRRLRSTAL